MQEEQKLAPNDDTETDEQLKGAVYRQDGGPGSVKRERQPGFGGMDARPSAAGEEGWQNVTSDRYGHPVSSEAEEAEAVKLQETED